MLTSALTPPDYCKHQAIQHHTSQYASLIVEPETAYHGCGGRSGAFGHCDHTIAMPTIHLRCLPKTVFLQGVSLPTLYNQAYRLHHQLVGDSGSIEEHTVQVGRRLVLFVPRQGANVTVLTQVAGS